MIRMTRHDGAGAVDLFEGDDEGEFVLQGESAEGPEETGRIEQLAGVAIGPADDEGDGAGGLLPGIDLRGELAAGELLAVFIENHPETSFAAVQQFGAFAGRVARLDSDYFERGKFSEAREILVSSGFGVGEGGFADG